MNDCIGCTNNVHELLNDYHNRHDDCHHHPHSKLFEIASPVEGQTLIYSEEFSAFINMMNPGNGSQGHQGGQGSQGYQGYQGSNGTQGVQGLQGSDGSNGVQGYQGDQGYQGYQGDQGYQGPQGSQGSAISETIYLTFDTLLAGIPSPNIDQVAKLAGGGLLKYTSGGWVGDLGYLGVWANKPTVGATGVGIGAKAMFSRFYGNGYFEARADSDGWSVSSGQCIASLSSTVNQSAGSTTYVQMVAYTIPCIRNFEVYAITCCGRNTAYSSGTDVLNIRMGGSATNQGNIGTISIATCMTRKRSLFQRVGNDVQRRSATTADTYINLSTNSTNVPNWSTLVIECGFANGSITNTTAIDEFSIYKES